MIVSAGLVLKKRNKILLCHPSNAAWTNTYSLPKGHVEANETNIDAAIRETKEEVGILIDKVDIETTEYYVDYKNKKDKDIYKRVYFYVVNVDKYNLPDVIDKAQLQLEEVDWAGFLEGDELKVKIFWRFRDLLKIIGL